MCRREETTSRQHRKRNQMSKASKAQTAKAQTEAKARREERAAIADAVDPNENHTQHVAAGVEAVAKLAAAKMAKANAVEQLAHDRDEVIEEHTALAALVATFTTTHGVSSEHSPKWPTQICGCYFPSEVTPTETNPANRNRFVLICGSREWTTNENAAQMRAVLHASLVEGNTVIHGGARGADSTAARIVGKMAADIEVIEYKPNWTKPDGSMNRAGAYQRNQTMLEEALLAQAAGRPVIVVAFKDGFQFEGRGSGTEHMIELARKAGLAVKIYGAKTRATPHDEAEREVQPLPGYADADDRTLDTRTREDEVASMLALEQRQAIS